MRKSKKQSYEFSEQFNRGDMTHRGPFDFYERCETEIKAAIESGLPFDTDWRGCKHEILSSRIQREPDGSFCCEVSVSDDFDTSGIGREGFVPEPGAALEAIWEELERVMDTAHVEADNDRKESQDYRGFSIMVRQRNKRQKLQRWDKSKPRKIGRSNRRLYCLDYYILDTSWYGMDEPPGDYYYEWGFQGEAKALPLNVREALEDYAQSYRAGSPPQFTYKRWTIKPWEGDEY